ncbi:MAG: hypothetical protein D6719_03915 [Candidatus Dadabacteria bacterium]|nr:MAG: hypothetical protein D6719_03915 [Candidatus Dadabacteria bacterium]
MGLRDFSAKIIPFDSYRMAAKLRKCLTKAGNLSKVPCRGFDLQQSALAAVIGNLSQLEQEVIFGVYRFRGYEEPLEDLAKRLNISVEQVKEIRDRALRKLGPSPGHSPR